MPNYEEMDGSPVENDSPEGFSATRRLLCAWSQRASVLNSLLNASYPYRKNSGAVAKRGRSSGFGRLQQSTAPGELVKYEKAVIEIQYSAVKSDWPTPEILPDMELYSETIEPNAEFLTLPPEDFCWEWDAEPDNIILIKQQEAPGLLIRGADYTVTALEVTGLSNACFSLIGFVNNAPYHAYLLDYVFPLETLRYDGPMLERTTSTAGMGTWRVTFRYSYKPQFNLAGGEIVGWNHYYRASAPAGKEFQRMLKVKDGTPFNQAPLGDLKLIQTHQLVDITGAG